MPTPEALGDLAEALVPVAARLVGAVHDEGITGVSRVLADLDPNHRTALCVVLAAMVDPDRTPSELLAWVTWDETPAEAYMQPSLLAVSSEPPAPALPTDPREWPDEVCLDYHRMSRRKNLPQPVDYRMEIGAKEWDRRRAARAREQRRAS
ncbi:hypothetical protein [Phycicoccus sp.]|uniref:hypothetical protein n=1 Tax=Phycicoccus sp. TaxID=1902410 RepID=UPI002B823A98|nr:hypothetical protein [Phycicoccus sp.]HMM95378.1 hypothetical protein [Phycicoccus sp.]